MLNITSNYFKNCLKKVLEIACFQLKQGFGPSPKVCSPNDDIKYLFSEKTLQRFVCVFS